MAIVGFDYYMNVFFGETIAENEFPKYEARAEDIILLQTRGRVSEDNLTSFPQRVQELIQKAICAQVEYLSIYGIDIANTGVTSGGFTVGKVSVNNGGNSTADRIGAKSMISPLAINYLEQTGLLDPSVSVVDYISVIPFRGFY